MRKRTQSREFALQILYQIDISHAKLDEAEEDFWKDRTDLDEDSTVRKYAHQLAAGSLKNMESIDQIIERCAENWQMSRMAAVDRNILRLAAFEIIYLEEVPAKVAINEAVELAKRYGEDDSSKFVNGILDKIAKTQCKK